MPLRDHFHPPISRRHQSNSFHGQWIRETVRQLITILPKNYTAAPSIHIGTSFEVDIGRYETEYHEDEPGTNSSGGTATMRALTPTLTVEYDLADQDQFEVKIYDDAMTLIAAIELVSPSNKDRPESRNFFVGKVDALLSLGICVSIVDLVTNRHANLYAELLARLNHTDPRLGTPPTSLYAVTLRTRTHPKRRPLMDAWSYPMSIDHPLPTLPIWLNPDMSVMLPLEIGYEETCKILRIGTIK